MNSAMEYAYGLNILPEEFKNCLKGGKYGLECAFAYLIRAQKRIKGIYSERLLSPISFDFRIQKNPSCPL